MSKKTKPQVTCIKGTAVIVNKSDWAKRPPDNIAKVDVDHMPKEVATEMLCAPKARTTNRERKIWQAARQNSYQSTRTAIPPEEKVANKLKSYTWLQINKWLERTVEKRHNCQCRFNSLQKWVTKLEADPKKNQGMILLLTRQMSALDLHVVSLDAYRDALETEVDRRRSFCARVREVSPTVAKAVEQKLCSLISVSSEEYKSTRAYRETRGAAGRTV